MVAEVRTFCRANHHNFRASGQHTWHVSMALSMSIPVKHTDLYTLPEKESVLVLQSVDQSSDHTDHATCHLQFCIGCRPDLNSPNHTQPAQPASQSVGPW